MKHQQQGATLLIALIVLLVMSMMTINGLQTTVLEEKMATGSQNNVASLHAAESAIDRIIRTDTGQLSNLRSQYQETTINYANGANDKATAEVTVTRMDDPDNRASCVSVGAQWDNQLKPQCYEARSTATLNAHTQVTIIRGFYHCPLC